MVIFGGKLSLFGEMLSLLGAHYPFAIKQQVTCVFNWSSIWISWFRSRPLQWPPLLVERTPWPPSAWPSAKHWPARARSSTSPFPLVPTSPSPWTPGAREWKARWSRKRQVPQPLGEMPGEEKNLWQRSSKALHLGFPVVKIMLPRLPGVTNVSLKQFLKRG